MLKQLLRIIYLTAVLFAFATPTLALDTDIYQSNVKQNCYILLDSSGSMGFGVYESNINYGAMFDYLLTLNDSPVGDYDDYIYDTQNNSSVFYQNHHPRNRIYLVPGDIGVTARSDADGDPILDDNSNLQLFSGDAADPEYVWYSASMIDTYTDIDSNGNLVAANPMPADQSQRLTVDVDGYILFDNQRLPESRDVEYRHQQQLFGGGVIEDGFGDLVNAPGYYFSGYTYDFINHIPKDASGGETIAYFFITGNWMNMQQVYNLHYTTNNPDPQGASTGDAAWQFETYPFLAAGDAWPTVDYNLDYPSGSVDYESGIEVEESITHPGAEKMRVHFDVNQFDINSDGSPDNKKDWVIIQSEDGSVVASYNNDNLPADGWSPEIEGNTARIILDSYSDTDSVGTGYVIDQYAYYDGEYKMKNRLEIATSSILNTIEHFRGEINWGTFTFPVANGSDGATSHQVINPNLNDDENRENIASDFKNVTPEGGTPIGEALQEVFEVGYYQHRNSIDNLNCRRNYAIVLSDGFPSQDNNWNMIGDITSDPHLPFEDWDNDGFTSDPYQPPTSFNYYDDVAHWMYTHSWLDKTEVSDPANSYVNVSSHQISFGFHNPLMEDAADEAGGLYITAYNEGQLNAAFYAIGLAIAEAVSFTAPVVSVDAANKIQNGDDLYMGQFVPMDATFWPGNLKKFKLGDGSDLRPNFWQIYDAGTTIGENVATGSDGNFLEPEKLEGFWHATDPDFVGLPIHHDGVGEVLTARVTNNLNSDPYGRTIKTLIGSSLVAFNPDLTTSDTAVSLDDLDNVLGTDATTRNKIINFVHGYTFDADAATGDPVAAREWALGAIVHSRPTVIDYYGDDYSTIEKRLIAVGADDGMLHVFYDDMSGDGQTSGTINDDGSEVFAYVPTDILPKLKNFETELHIPMVDGLVKLFREDGQPKYLIFGLRRGGRSYVRIDVSDIDPTNWTVDEITTNNISELGQTWSDVTFAKIQTSTTAADAQDNYTDVVIFSGGYDAEEDNFPEPFNDLDNNGTPYEDNGQIDGAEWDRNDSDQDLYAADNSYTIANPVANNHGRGIFVVNLDTLAPVFSVTYNQGAEATPTTADVPAINNTFSSQTSQTRSDMKYCFPATPSIVSFSELFNTVRIDKVLTAIYAPDIYGNLFRVIYDYNNGTPQWQVTKLFSSNPSSSSESSEIRDGIDNDDFGRKVFYGPAVSWRGSGRYHDRSNYSFPGYTFDGTQSIASLFFGTGDRVHPTYQLIKNRVYAIYDDIPVTANGGAIKISTAPYNENDLLNITCDELGVHTVQQGMTSAETWSFKTELETILTDDVSNSGAFEYFGGALENDSKGWYIILQDQGSSTYCDHCDYEATVDDTEGGRDYHVGEKVLSKFILFAGNLYFTTYQPAYDDPCAPEGNAFSYALNYLNGSAGLNLNTDNDLSSTEADYKKKDVTDRYRKYSGVKGIGSGFEIVIRGGEAGAVASLGGGIIGGGEDDDDDDDNIRIPYEDSGISLYYWIEK